MDKKYEILKIEELVINERVEGVLFLQNFDYRTKKNNDFWTLLNLSDGDYSIAGKYWNGKLDLEGAALVEFTGTVGEYMGKKDITLNSVTTLDIADEDLPSPVNIKKYYNNIRVFREYIKDPDLLFILDKLIFDQPITADFYQLPAAISHHHNYRGGLVEHTFQVASTAYYLSNIYEGINRELVVTGALLHDIGKLKVYGIDKLTPTYDSLAGMEEHLYLGVEMVRDLARDQGLDIDGDKLRLVLNIIGSHHLRGDWGAIFKPNSMEAYLVHYADLISSRVNGIQLLEEPNKDIYSPFYDDMRLNLYSSQKIEEIMAR